VLEHSIDYQELVGVLTIYSTLDRPFLASDVALFNAHRPSHAGCRERTGDLGRDDAADAKSGRPSIAQTG
jgi:hypothetical protein